jgi:predicted MPP superfamily phosphohydrolase
MSAFARLRLLVQSAAVALALTLTAWPPAFTDARSAQSVQTPAGPSAIPLTMPNKDGSLKFGVLGDFGTGEKPQYEMAAQIARVHQQFKFNVMLLVGDNLYGSERPQDYQQKFEMPYKSLLDAGVEFRAALGNHDSREQRKYPKFNMNGEYYYSFKAPTESVRFIALESTYPTLKQIVWLEKQLKEANEDWKIVYFHHSLYCSAGRHGSDRQLRDKLEPLFVAYNVSVVFTGHDHVYERTKPQKDIVHFVVGSGGKVAPGDLDRNSPITAKGFDADQAFLIAEISKDEMAFNAVSRSGKVIDSGKISRRQVNKPAPSSR